MITSKWHFTQICCDDPKLFPKLNRGQNRAHVSGESLTQLQKPTSFNF